MLSNTKVEGKSTLETRSWWWWWLSPCILLHDDDDDDDDYVQCISRVLCASSLFLLHLSSDLLEGEVEEGGYWGKKHVISCQHCHHWSHKVTIIVHIVVSWFCSVLTYSGCLAPDRACGGNRDSQPRIKSVGLKKDPDQPSSLSPAAHYYYCCALGSLPLPTLSQPGVI